MTPTPEEIKKAVRDRYALAAEQAAAAGCCCGPAADCCSADPAGFGISAYTDLAPGEVPDAARLASLGCGNPTAIAGLKPGERVLDLGSGGGLDVFLAARQVGPTGFVYGVDMTDEMLALARANQRAAGVTNVEFRKGEIEHLPLPDAAVDVDPLQLRHQPVHRQAGRVPRGAPRAGAGGPLRRFRRCGPAPPVGGGASRPGLLGRMPRRCPDRRGVPGRALCRRVQGCHGDAHPGLRADGRQRPITATA